MLTFCFLHLHFQVGNDLLAMRTMIVLFGQRLCSAHLIDLQALLAVTLEAGIGRVENCNEPPPKRDILSFRGTGTKSKLDFLLTLLFFTLNCVPLHINSAEWISGKLYKFYTICSSYFTNLVLIHCIAILKCRKFETCYYATENISSTWYFNFPLVWIKQLLIWKIYWKSLNYLQ